MLRIGLVDFDTSHVVAFTQRLNHLEISPSEWVTGARVVAGCPGRSTMMPERIAGYAKLLGEYGIDLVETLDDLIPLVDAVMIESQMGDAHLERARPVLAARLPVFIDKPFAATTEQADEIISLARIHAAPVISWSALRFDPAVQEAIELQEKHGRILSADVWSSAPLHPGNPGLLHYGIHGVEMLYALLGLGCEMAQTVSNEFGEVTTGTWADGRIGVMRGLRREHPGFGFTAHYEHGHVSKSIEGAAFYKKSLEKIVAVFESRTAPVDLAETREIIAFINTAKRSGDAGGKATKLR